jgi:hypothetical protein
MRPAHASLAVGVFAATAVLFAMPAFAQSTPSAPPRPGTSTAGTAATAPAHAGNVQSHAGASASATVPRLLDGAELEAARQAEAKQRDEKQALAERMDAVAQRWRKRAAAEGWKVHAVTDPGSNTTRAR